MSADIHTYRHSLTGQLAEMTEDAASVFPEYLERVDPDTKPYLPEMFKPGKIGEFDNPVQKTEEEIAAEEAKAQAIADLKDSANSSKKAN
jgi:hypothetical protein